MSHVPSSSSPQTESPGTRSTAPDRPSRPGWPESAAGFAAAVALRIRTLSAFGVGRTSGRWILIAVGAGVAAFGLKGLAIWVWIQIFSEGETVQAPYAAGG